jgi:uncharacterized protein (DUF1330 family)
MDLSRASSADSAHDGGETSVRLHGIALSGEGRTVVIEFESAEQAKQWYDSDAYQSISEVRRAHSESTMAILHGFELPKRN